MTINTVEIIVTAPHNMSYVVCLSVVVASGCPYLADVAEEAEVVVIVVIKENNHQVFLDVRTVGVHGLVFGVTT